MKKQYGIGLKGTRGHSRARAFHVNIYIWHAGGGLREKEKVDFFILLLSKKETKRSRNLAGKKAK